MYTMGFDMAAMRRLMALVNVVPTFMFYYSSAMASCVAYVINRAQHNAPVVTGTLRRGITGYVANPMLGVVGVQKVVPYGARREFGFDGQTDRLGRYYAMDPKDATKRAHMYYLKRGLDESRPYIESVFRTATSLAVRQALGAAAGGL